ncbi:universal stress protein [Mongoliitalea daihaiensis]|uniref:universal stress protein n=1 Tax=Mongoliitalea daihaiensis TaxID=2782006 RepID=UPI001F1B33B0|nr:universal stress protein [Mongoliitalea daihaiensis]UJP64582.1 universal stress protein [Mongoliitalea daihaiensis]
MKILVPTDFSENAFNALAFAKNIAKQQNSSLTLFYAFYAVYDFAAQATEIIAQIEDDAKKAMKKLVKEGLEEGLTIDYKIQHGSIATAVTSYAYQNHYDLIVMGTQGASGIKKTLMGSNTGHVIKESMVPVLAVPTSASLPKEDKIAIALELKKESEENFKKLFQLTEALNLPYNFFHVGEKMSFDQEIEFKGLEAFLKANHANKSFEFQTIQASNIQKGVQNYLGDNPNVLLVMFSKQKSFFEYLFNKSETLEMAYHTHVPLLVIK